MNIPRMIAELQAERNRLNEAIAALERLSAATAKKRGATPSWKPDGKERPKDGKNSSGETGEAAPPPVS